MSDDLLAHIPPVSKQFTDYPPRPGNRVAPWIDGVPFYERLLEVLRAARVRVWVAVSFVERGFVFPGGRTFWEELDDCVMRDVDVRVLFWRNPSFVKTQAIFQGDASDRAFLAERGTRWLAKWDCSPQPAHCHHQKAWVVDGLAFVGGMVLTASTLQTSDHRGRPESKHDAFLELEGPATRDAAHNFTQRWNEARQDGAAPWPDAASATPLPEPAIPPAAGEVTVQLSRTIPPEHYPSCPSGETSLWRQYRAAFTAARETIYLENQHPGEEELLGLLDDALRRGVEVVYVLPAEPMDAIRAESEAARRHLAGGGPPSRYTETFRRLVSLGRHERFTLAALARNWSDGERPWAEVYVHAKLCVVDGVWATCGSANLVDLSLHPDHTELNACFWDADSAGALLSRLVDEHTDRTPADHKAALAIFREVAVANAARRARGEPLVGHCYALDPAAYPP